MYPTPVWTRWAVDLPLRAGYQRDASGRGPWFMSGNGGNAVALIDQLDAVVVITRAFYNQGRTMHNQTKALIEQAILPDLACPAPGEPPGA